MEGIVILFEEKLYLPDRHRKRGAATKEFRSENVILRQMEVGLKAQRRY